MAIYQILHSRNWHTMEETLLPKDDVIEFEGVEETFKQVFENFKNINEKKHSMVVFRKNELYLRPFS